MFKKSLVLVILLKYIYNDYFNVLKKPQNLKNDSNYGVLGGSISSYLNLNNEFLITFWFKFSNFENKIFPFISIFDENKILSEFIFYKNLKSILSANNFSKKINILENQIYFCKIGIIKNNDNELKIILKIYNNINDFIKIEETFNKQTKIDDITFIINRYNLKEDLLIEKLIFYKTIDSYSDLQLMNGVSNILYFINFRHNYPNTKWLTNEINNEFGPSLNGKNNENINMFNANFNKLNYEINWKSSSNNSQIYINNTIITYLNQFKLLNSQNIFFKLNLFFNFIRFNNDTLNFEILNFYNNRIGIKINFFKLFNLIFIEFYFISSNNQKFQIINKFMAKKDTINLHLNFIWININKKFNSTYNINNYINFKKNTFFCNKEICTHNQNLNFNHKINNEKKILIELINDHNRILYLTIFLKEFIIGEGNLIFNEHSNELIIESKNIENKFLIYNKKYENLERRFNFFNTIDHSLCLKNYCSICRKDLNICEFCYKNYYLSEGNCILNNDLNKFVNNYSLIKDHYKLEKNFIIKSFVNYTFNLNWDNNYLNKILNLKINLQNNYKKNIIIRFFSIDCENKFSFFYDELEIYSTILNLTIFSENIDCLKKLVILNYNNNNNQLINPEISYNKESINCIQNYKDLLCNIGCSRNDDYFIKFDNSLYYSSCNNENINYYTKNRGYFKYYSKCPSNCKNCIVDSNNSINCSECETGYILKNNECIIKLFINCNKESNFNISNNNSKNFLYNCNNLCDYIDSNKNLNTLIRYYNNKKDCDKKDKIFFNCDNIGKFYNKIEKICDTCINNNCIDFECNKCNKTNNFFNCSNDYKFVNYKCILNKYYEINCNKYKINENLKLYVCNECKSTFFLNNDNFKCIIRNTDNCLNYIFNSYICKKCFEGYYLDNLNNCEKCNNNCKECKQFSKFCISCNFGYKLENNKCIFNKIYTNNCKIINKNKFCSECNKGFYLNSHIICEKCDNKCKECGNNNFCLSCEKNYILFNNKCRKKLENCSLINKENINICDKCYDGFFINKNFECNACNNNCLNCIKNSTNCLSCNNNGLLIKNDNDDYCKYKCVDNNHIFNKNLKKCIKCNIDNIEEYKLYNKSLNYDKNKFEYFKIDIIKYKYFIIINIPHYINKDSISNESQLKNNIKFLLNKVHYKFEYLININFENKKILLIPILNSYLKELNISLKINNIFENFKECTFKEQKFILNINNYNITEYKNDINIKLNKEFSIANKNSQNYKVINKLYNVSKTTTNTLIIGNFILSIFSPSILSKLSVFLSNLLFFNYLILLKVNFGENINTIFSFINFNPKIIDLNNYVKLNKNSIYNKISHLLIMNSKFIYLKLLLISNLTLNYIIMNILLLIILIIYFFKMLIKLIILFINYLKKMNNNFTTKSNDIKFFVSNLKQVKIYKDIIFKKRYQNFKKLNIKIIDILILYFFALLISELPNIILTWIIYYSSFKFEFYNKTMIFINIIIIYNTLLLIIFFYYNFYLINLFSGFEILKNKDFYLKINQYFLPFDSNTDIKDSFIIYYKIFENLRIVFSLSILFYLNYDFYFQIVLLIIIQTFYIIFIYISTKLKFFSVILWLKELFILLFLFLIIYLKLAGMNYILEFLLIVNILIIFILSIFEFAFINIKKIILLWKLLFNKLKSKFKNKKNLIKNLKIKNVKVKAMKKINI